MGQVSISHNISESVDSTHDYVFNMPNTRTPPILMKINFNNVQITMEADSSSYCFLMCEQVYNETWSVSTEWPQIMKCSNNLNVYGGAKLRVLCEIKVVEASDLGNRTKAKIIRAKENRRTLMGRSLMSYLKMDNIYITNVNKVSTNWK